MKGRRELSKRMLTGYASAGLLLFITWWMFGAIAKVSSQNNNYVPPAASRPLLGTIPLEQAAAVERRFAGGKKILKLPSGAIYIDADMDVDADGSPRARTIDPCCGQLQTAFNFPNQTGQAQYVNAEVVPYVVLPGNNKRVSERFYRQMGLQVGDIAAVIYKDRIEFALFADVGPVDKIGEGSIALAESLRHDSFITRNGRRIIGRGIPGEVLYIVFPRSKMAGLTPQNVVSRVREKGRELFANLGGQITP